MSLQTRIILTSKYGITEPAGFVAGAVYCGLKTLGEKPLDLGVLFSRVPCNAAGVFTTSKVRAAPVLLSQKHLLRGKARAIVVNAGCANACNGARGLRAASTTAELTAAKLGIAPEEVLVASTGVIGRQLPLGKIRAGLKRIAVSRAKGHDLAQAIMTTDTCPKEIVLRFRVGGAVAYLAGIAKGAGMIHPNMATMLSFITTDAAVEGKFLQKALAGAVSDSFNMITVDGDTSTNDSVFLLANGLAGNRIITEGTPEAGVFQSALKRACLHLAKCIAADGEGATRLIEVTVAGAASDPDARLGARTIAGSSLVKTAVYGNDPNWGRILAALGRSGAQMDEARVSLYLDSLCLMKNGAARRFDEQKASAKLKRKKVRIRLELGLGTASATAWGCDLTEKYIATNSEYTT